MELPQKPDWSTGITKVPSLIDVYLEKRAKQDAAKELVDSKRYRVMLIVTIVSAIATIATVGIAIYQTRLTIQQLRKEVVSQQPFQKTDSLPTK